MVKTTIDELEIRMCELRAVSILVVYFAWDLRWENWRAWWENRLVAFAGKLMLVSIHDDAFRFVEDDIKRKHAIKILEFSIQIRDWSLVFIEIARVFESEWERSGCKRLVNVWDSEEGLVLIAAMWVWSRFGLKTQTTFYPHHTPRACFLVDWRQVLWAFGWACTVFRPGRPWVT